MTDNEMPPQCRAELYVSRYNDHYRCVRPENHAGRHQDDDNDTWDITYVDKPGVLPQAVPVDIRVHPVQDQLTALTTRVGLLEADRACAPVYLTEPGKEQGDYLHGRAHGDLIKELYQRLSKLEAAWTVGGETLSERLDRVVMGAMEQIRASAQGTERRSDSLERMFMALREDATRMHSRITGLESRMNPRECHGEQCVKPTVLATQVDGRQLMSDGSVRDSAESGPAC